MKKRVGIFLIAVVLVLSGELFANGTDEKKAGKADAIQIECGFGGAQLSAFEAIVDGFTEESGIDVSIIVDGDYEATMKTRMASNDLPDVWFTHGWSVIRYSEYLMPLQDQPWYDKIDESILGAITDADGNIFILPVSEAVAGVLYNKDVITAAGIDVGDIRTWDDFTDALAMIKAHVSDVAPIFMGCNTGSIDAYTAEVVWPTFWTNPHAPENQIAALQGGTFDWNNARPFFSMLADWQEAGYYNVDTVSADFTEGQQALANGDCGFLLYSTEMIPGALTYNPDAHIGVMPVPAVTDQGASYYGVGEGNASCFGIYKDTKHEAECKTLLAYMARPAVAQELIEKVDGGIPALSDTNLTDAYVVNAFKESQSIFEGDLTYDNFFDRVYLPSGMWDVMHNAVATFFDGNQLRGNIDPAIKTLQTNYDTLTR